MDTDLQHILAETERRLNSLDAMVRQIQADCQTRDAREARMAASMEAVADKLNTICNAMTGDIGTPEVPGMIARMADLRNQQQTNTIALAEIRQQVATVKTAFDDYRALMPSAAEIGRIKTSSDLQTKRWTLAAGWIGGAGFVLTWIWKLVETFIAHSK